MKTKEKKADDTNISLLGNNQKVGSKYTQLTQYLGEIYNDISDSTSSSEKFKKALEDNKFGGNTTQFNQYLVVLALTLEYLKKVAEGDEELKKLLPSLEEKRKAINENIEKIAPELGYTVFHYSLKELEGRDLRGVEEKLTKDFDEEPKLEVLFSPEVLNSITELFAFIVNRSYPSSGNESEYQYQIVMKKKKKKEKKEKEKQEEDQKKLEDILSIDQGFL